jgi:transcriptional regulator with XRE-family HTH domain
MEEPPATTYLVKGAAIRTRRKELGMTQAECAAAARISRPYLSQLETRARQNLTPPTYKALRTALDVQLHDTRLLDQQEPHRKD